MPQVLRHLTGGSIITYKKRYCRGTFAQTIHDTRSGQHEGPPALGGESSIFILVKLKIYFSPLHISDIKRIKTNKQKSYKMLCKKMLLKNIYLCLVLNLMIK